MEAKNRKNKPGKQAYETRTRRIAGQIRTNETEGNPRIEAYFAVFGDKYQFADGCYETIDPAAFDGQLNGDVRALIDHDTRLVLGRTKAGTLRLKADAHGLYGVIEINTEDVDAMNLYARVKRGDVTQCSFGFEILDEEQRMEANGAVHFIIRKVKLYEVSVVTFPAYEDTIAAARSKSIRESRSARLEAWKASMRSRLNATKKHKN